MANSPLENLKQEPKQIIDINQAMNGLLQSIASTVAAKTPTIGQLSNIRNILINIRAANKDLNFIMTPETTAAIEKTLSTVTLPDNFERKVDNQVLTQPIAANSKIDQTIQTITSIISVMLATEKSSQNIPETQRIDKALVEVLVTLLGGGLKQFAAINLPKDETIKNEINVSLSGNKNIKQVDTISKPPDTTAKIINPVAAPKDIFAKQVFGIGQIPDFTQKNIDELATFPAKGNKNVEDVIDTATKLVKNDDTVDYHTVFPSEKNDLGIQDLTLLLPNEGKTATDASTTIYNATRAEEKNEDSVPSSNNKFEKAELIENGVTDTTAKVQHDLANITPGAGKLAVGLGATLDLFGITSLDLGLLATSAIRDFNTLVNAAELTLQMQSSSFLASLLGAGFQNTPTSGKTNLPNDADNISLRILQLAPPEQKPVTVYQQQDAAIDFPNKDVSGFASRTFTIVSSNPGTGFLKIYLNRGPKFSDSESVTQVIPFQFEPVISGDAKAAEYSQISTLARSQAAQVYRKSQERTISLELSYLVTAPPPSGTPGTSVGVNNSQSQTVGDGTGIWTEDYIYNYVVRNLKNLILPNIINTSFKLAPPIVQVWYGGIDSTIGSSTGEGLQITFGQTMPLNDVHPTFRTNWYTYDGSSGNFAYRAYRSLWVVQNVSFEYKGGIVNSQTRRAMQIVATLSLIEISPSATDNELVIWNANDTAIAPGQQYTSNGVSYM
jgi:hypothetical protein